MTLDIFKISSSKLTGAALHLYIVALLLGPNITNIGSYYLIFALIIFLQIKNIDFSLYPFQKLWFALVTCQMMSLLVNLFSTSYTPSYRDLVVIFSPAQYVLLVLLLRRIPPEQLLNSVRLLILLMLPVLVIGFLQFFDIGGVKNLLETYYAKSNVEVWQEYSIWHNRATSTFSLEPNTFGLYCVFMIVVSVLITPVLGSRLWQSLGLALLSLVGIALSGSITALVSLVVSILIYGIVNKKIRKKILAFAVLGFAILATIIPDIVVQTLERQKLGDELLPSSFTYRIANAWADAYAIYMNNPIWGIGPAAEVIGFSSDNEYLDAAMRYGTTGLAMYVLFLAGLVLIPAKRAKSLRQPNHLLKAFYTSSSLLALVVALSAVTGTVTKSKRLMEVFWLLYAIPYVLDFRRLEQRKESEDMSLTRATSSTNGPNPYDEVERKDWLVHTKLD